MKKKHLLLFVSLILVSQLIWGQTKFINEGFENNGSIPTGWTQYKKSGTTSAIWDFTDGGVIPPGGDDGLPPAAHSGQYNARFFKSSFSTHEAYLISPKFSFEFAQKPELRFWYSQYEDQLPGLDPDNNKFKVYYRTPEEGNVWVLLKEFLEPTEGWVFDSIPFADSITNKKYKEIQLGFLGISATASFGSCIDDVLLIETDTVTKYIEKVYATQPNLDIIPSGSINNPILRLRFPVQGNDGTLILDSLVVTALDKASSVVATNGVKLFHTTTDYFSSTRQIGTGISLVNGKAIFDNLNFELPYGNSYIWVTYDIPVDTEHKFKDVLVDAKIEVNSILVNNSYFPLSELNPNGNRKINESVFFDDFESNKNWELAGEFQRDTALGLGGFYQNTDPSYAISGVKVLGTDLTGLGTKLGDYEPGIGIDEYYAKTPTFNCTYYKDLNIQFYRWLNVNFGDTAAIDYSFDGGTTWHRAWQNNALIADNAWGFQQISLTSLVDRAPSVTLRYVLGPTGESQFLSGWNIDNFAFTGTYVNNDIGIAQVITPIEGCGHTATDPFEVVVKNYGFDVTNDTLPLKYSINNGTTWVIDTLFTAIPQGGSISFTFKKTADFSQPGYYNVIVSTNLPNDEDSRNNTISQNLFMAPTYTLPYFQNFEANYGYWKKGGVNTTWEHGVPNGTIIKKAYSGTKCWTTKLTANYSNNDSAWLESPCFDFTSVDKPIIDFMLRTDAEKNNDGLALYYNVNDEVNWHLVPKVGTYDWNWYNNPSVTALNTAGWDSVSTSWFKARQILPSAVANQPKVKFRFLFMSNDTITKNGFAIDDISIYNAPTDAGIAAIVAPKSSCSLDSKQAVTVAVKNYGVRPITPSDTIFVKAIINNETTLIDTFKVSSPLAVNATTNFTFKQTTNMSRKKWYRVKALTQVKGDTAYYYKGIYNDTLTDSAYVKGEPLYSLGPNIGTYNSDTIILNGGVHSVGGANFIHYLWKYELKPDSSGIADNRYFNVPQFPVGEDFLDFTIRVQNDSGCYAYDTIQIIKSQVDIGISNAVALTNKCFDAQTQSLEVTVKNFTTGYTMLAGTQIKVGYVTNETEFTEQVSESFTLLSNLAPLATTTYTFDSIPTFTTDGTFNVKAFTIVNADLAYTNDTLTLPVTIYPEPNVNIGPDSILTLRADTITLDAGPGYTAYLWQDNSTNQTFSILGKQTAMYSVTVNDANGCGTATDSLLVVSENWVLKQILNPETQCAPTATEQISINLLNSSPNAYAAGYSIPASFNINGTAYTEPIVLGNTLNANASIVHSFSPVYNLSQIGEYLVNVAINPTHDISRTDNSLDSTVNIWGLKSVELGPDTIVTHKADTILLDAGFGFETYSWQDLSENQTYHIPDKTSSKYWVSVTDYNACPASNDTVQIIAMDLAMEELVSPEPKCYVNSIENIIFTLRNTGPDIISYGEPINIGYSIDGGSTIWRTYAIPFNLQPNQTKQVTLNEPFNFSEGNHYDFKVFIDWDKDFFNDNDTLTSEVYQLEHPEVYLGNDIYTTMADTVVLKVPEGFTTYYWQNSSRENSFDVENNYTDEYWVQVRNAYGCEAADTMMIYTYDIGIESFGEVGSCSAQLDNLVSINVKMNSADSLLVGDKINASYTFNGTTVNETITLTDKLNSGYPYSYTFLTPLNVSDTGNYNISASVNMANEVVTNNNALSGSFRVGPKLVNLGSDIVTYNNSVTLNAGTGYSSYLWNTNATTQTINVTSTGNYSVTTTDTKGCEASDDINVTFIKGTYEIEEIIGFEDDCIHSPNSIITFALQNTGNDTITTGTVITISYQINQLSLVNENYTFAAPLRPGNTLNVSFNTSADLSAAGNFTVNVTALIAGTTLSADTTFTNWGVPEVWLGDDIKTVESSVLLDAGPGHTAYLWNTSATTQTITVSQSGTYYVTVSNSIGCQNTDMINVSFLPYYLKAISLVAPVEGCQPLTNKTVTIIVKNMGSNVVPAGTVFKFGYEAEGSSRVDENIQFANAMQPNGNFTYTFDKKLTTQAGGDVGIDFYTSYDNKELDTTSFIIQVIEKPEFFGGNDTIHVEAYPYLLDAQVAALTYNWNTGQTTSSITVNADGNYWLTITQANNCTFTDTVLVIKGLDINEDWFAGVRVYPNPGSRELWIDIPESIGEVNLQINDINGKIIYKQGHISGAYKIEINEWHSGVYILNIIDGQHRGTFQIIKQ